MLTVQGIVVRTIKYGETSVILDLYTKEKGLISCIAGGVRKKRSTMPPAAFQLLQIIRATIYYKDGDKLSRIKEVHPIALYHSLIEDPVKRVIVLFLSELIQKSIREKEERADLFEYLELKLKSLNELSGEGIANFHLIFMLELTKYLGFYPQSNISTDRPYFDLLDGQFVERADLRRTLSSEESGYMIDLFDLVEGRDVEGMNSIKRRKILDVLISYYQQHIEGFGKMKSPDIIHVVLS